MVAPASPGWSEHESPFHAGEMAVQERLGVRGKMETAGRKVIRRYMPDQHRDFFAQLPFVIAGAVDAAGQPWASILPGAPGFLHSPTPESLAIDAAPAVEDPIAAGWHHGARIGLLGIELATRRRNRLNGALSAVGRGWLLDVAQSFGNCPKYIQARTPVWLEPAIAPPAEIAPDVSTRDHALIATAATFFIASRSLEIGGLADGTDISHRGGRPGFVRIDGRATLTTPDFVGNWLFNTLGNLTLDARAGLLFVDWARGDLLQIAAKAEIVWEGPEVAAFNQAQRLVRFHISQVIRRPGVLPFRWSAPQPSPFLESTGTWPEYGGRLP